MINNIGKILYGIWFFFYSFLVLSEIFVLSTQSLGERKLGMLLVTALLLLIGIVLFLSTVFIVKGKMQLAFIISFVVSLFFTYLFYIYLKENGAIKEHPYSLNQFSHESKSNFIS
ncbi:hypothetical protein [Flavobacterium pedocola]